MADKRPLLSNTFKIYILIIITVITTDCSQRTDTLTQNIDISQNHQKYWDGNKALTPGDISVATRENSACPDRLRAYLALERQNSDKQYPNMKEYDRPELMAIGDSLYNGVQSMRINWWLSEWSPPALVAIRLGLIQEWREDRTGTRTFYGPQYPTYGSVASSTQDFGFSLEKIPPRFSVLRAPLQQIAPLRQLALDYTPDNGRAMVDNIAFSGANSHDLLFWTAADHANRALFYLDKLSSGGVTSRFSNLSAAFFHANATFVLNPTRDPCLANLTPLDHVMLRKPRRLLVNIGPNDGMWLLAFNGAATADLACSRNEAAVLGINGRPRCAAVSIEESMKSIYINNIRTLLERIYSVDGIETVYLNSIPLPSQTANLVPERRQGRLMWYSDMMSGKNQKSWSTDSQVKNADALIGHVNTIVSDLVDEMNLRQSGTHFVFVDTTTRLSELDAKQCVETDISVAAECVSKRKLKISKAQFGGGADVELDNWPVRLDGETGIRSGIGFLPKITQGGLFSFDNMHLSSVGYEVLAQAVVRAMRVHGEKDLLPALNPDGSDPCKKSNERGFHDMQPGDCAAMMTTPGWSYASAARRQFVFLRYAGLEETKDRMTLSARIAFLQKLLR